MIVLQVVIRPTPGQDSHLPADRVLQQNSAALETALAAAALQGLRLVELLHDEHGAPLPVDGHYWSSAQSQDFVAAAAAPWPVGVDIERVRRMADDTGHEVASPAEIAMVAERFLETKEEAFARIRCAKEALLKLSGEGHTGLARCLVAPSTSLESRPGIWIRSGDMEMFVHQERRGAHFVSLACEPVHQVEWIWQLSAAEQLAPRADS